MKRHALSSGTDIKLDAMNRKILAIVHKEANISNAELAERVGLSPSACSQRMSAMRKAGYFVSFTSMLDLDRICEHVQAVVEVELERNDRAARLRYTDTILKIPEFCDCLRVAGGQMDFVSYVCCSSVTELNRLCDELSGNSTLGIKRLSCRIIVERPKWFVGYPITKLKWFEE